MPIFSPAMAHLRAHRIFSSIPWSRTSPTPPCCAPADRNCMPASHLVLSEYFIDLVDHQPELVAHHLTAAGNHERAVDQWLKAGQLAASRSANLEAIAHLQRGVQGHTCLPLRDERPDG